LWQKCENQANIGFKIRQNYMETLMGEEENLEKTAGKDMTRRDFFANAFMGASLFAGLALLAYYIAQFLFPPGRGIPTRKIYITTIDKISPGSSFKFRDLKGQEITVTNTGDEFIALSTKCTHLGCQVHWKKDEKVFFCPCHDGYFDAQGAVLKGPPPKPLNSYKVEVVDKAIYIHVDEVWKRNV
jgi:Rieske Fe-S protein